MANSVNIPISLSLQSEDIVKEYKQAMQKLSNVSDLKNQFTEMLKLQAQYIANAEKIKDPLSKALNLQSAKEYSRLLNDIQNQVKKIDRDRLPEFEMPEIKFDNKQIINSFKGIDSEIQTIIDNIGTMNTMLGKSNVSEIFKGVGETQVTEYYKNIVALRKDIIKEEIKSGKVSSQSIENLLSVLQEAEVYQNRILQKNGKISDITKLLPKSIIDNEAFSKIMNRESLEVRWKEITMPGFVDNVRNAIMTKITQIATGEDFKLPTIGLEMDIDVANSFGEYQKKIDMATERLKKLVAKFYQTNEFRTDFQNLGISDDKSKTLNYYKLIFDIKSTMEEIETLSSAIGKSTKNIYGKKGLSGLVLNDYFSPDGDEYLGFNSIYKDLNSPENSKYLQIFKEKLISNISNGYKNVMTTVENETQDSLTKQLESINKILYTASDASYINNTSVEDEINSIIKSDDQAYTKLLNKRNEIISKLTDQGYEIESAVTDGIHGLVESNEIKKGKKVEFGRRKNDNKNNNINNVGSGSDSNVTTNDKSVEEMDRRISDIEQEIQNIKQRIETIGGEDKSNNNRVVDALQTQINELKNTVKNISGGGASTKEIEDSLKKMQNDILEITEKIIGQETLGVLRQNLDAVTAQINGLATTNQITQLQSQLEKVNQIVTLLDDNLKSINSRLNQMALNTPNSQNTSVSNSTTNSESVNQEADAYEKLNQIYAKYNELQNTHYEEEQFELRKKRLAQLKEYRIQLHELSKQIGEDDERIKDLTIKDGDKSLSLFSDEMTRNNIDERISELSRRQQDAINKKFDEFNKVKNRLNEIAPNGVVSESNLTTFEATVKYLNQLIETISNSEIYGDTTSFKNDITNLMNKAQNMTLPKRKVQTSPQRKNKQNNSSAATEKKPTNNTQNNTTSEEDNAIVNRLNTRIAALETKLNTLDRAKRDTKSRLTALEQTTGTTDASTKTLAKKSEVDAITNEINEIRKEINSLHTQMGNVVGRDVSSVDSKLDVNNLLKYAEALSLVTKAVNEYSKNIQTIDFNEHQLKIGNILTKEETDNIKNAANAINGLKNALKNYDSINKNIDIPHINIKDTEIGKIRDVVDSLSDSFNRLNSALANTDNAKTDMFDKINTSIQNISVLNDKLSNLFSDEKKKTKKNSKITAFEEYLAEYQLHLKNREANTNESFGYYNSKTKNKSHIMDGGSSNHTSGKMEDIFEKLLPDGKKIGDLFDTYIHTHPGQNHAVLSFIDTMMAVNDYVDKNISNMIATTANDYMSVDISKLDGNREGKKDVVLSLYQNAQDKIINELLNKYGKKTTGKSFVENGKKIINSFKHNLQLANVVDDNNSKTEISSTPYFEIVEKAIDKYREQYGKIRESDTPIATIVSDLLNTINSSIDEFTPHYKKDNAYKDQVKYRVKEAMGRALQSGFGVDFQDYLLMFQNNLMKSARNLNIGKALKVEKLPDISSLNGSGIDNINELVNQITSNISSVVDNLNVKISISEESISSIRNQLQEAFNENNPISISFKPNANSIRNQISDALNDTRIVGENDGKLNISANLTEEQIAVIREKLKAAFSGEQAIPISFVPNVEGLKQQIADALKDVPVEITNNNINKVIKVNKFKANSDGVEALRNSISSQLKNVKIQSFDATTAAESVKETLSKVLDGVGLKFDTEKLGNEVREAVNSGIEAASAEQKPETSDNKAVRFKEKATNDIGKLRDKYTDKLQGQQLEVFKERLNEIDNKIKEIKDDASNYTDENAQVIDKDIKQIELLVNSFKEINNSEDKINSLIQKLKDSKNNIERRGAVAQPVVNNINSEMSALEELKRSGQNLNVGNPAEVQAFIDKLHEADATVESLQQSAKDIRVSTNATASVAKLDSKFNDLLFKVDKFKRDNSKITSDKGISAQFDSLMRSIQTIEKSDVNFQRLRAQFDQLKATVQGKGLTGRSLGDELKYIAEKIGIKAMLGNSIYRVIGAFRQMVGIVTELDTGMTTLRRVTEETEATYRKFLSTAGDEAHELGSTVSNLVSSTGDFARLGYNIQESSELAKNALMYSNVGWLDIQTATADMTSTMKAFNITAQDSVKIVDVFDILGNKYAVTAANIGEGLKESASALATANNSMEQSAAMITAITEITQDASGAGELRCPKMWKHIDESSYIG